MSRWKYIWVAIVIAASLILFFIYPTGEETVITNFPASEGTLVAFGDSLVYGVGADTPGGFVTILEQRMGEEIINLGRGGDTTALGLDRLGEVLRQNPRIVFLLLGGNDFLDRVPKEDTFNNLNTIISRIQDDGAIVVLLGVRGGLIFDSHEDEYRKLAGETGSIYVSDVLYGLFGNPTFMFDAIHPNEQGYKIIAGRVYEAIESIL